MYYHFCSAMTKEDLDDLGGFDMRYAQGVGYDDNDFIYRVRLKGMTTKIIDNPFVIHQYHPPFCGNQGFSPTQNNYTLFNNYTLRLKTHKVQESYGIER